MCKYQFYCPGILKFFKLLLPTKKYNLNVNMTSKHAKNVLEMGNN